MSNEQGPEIRVKKEVDRRVANVGQRIRVMISVDNVGIAAAYDFRIRDVVPNGLEIVGSNESFARVNTIGPKGSFVHSYEVTSTTARRYRLPGTIVQCYKKGGLFKGRRYRVKSTRNPILSFVESCINYVPCTINFETTFKNTTRKKICVTKTLEILNTKGEMVKTLKRRPVMIKPNSEYVFEDKWRFEKDIARGIYEARAILEYEAEGKKNIIKNETKFPI